MVYIRKKSELIEAVKKLRTDLGMSKKSTVLDGASRQDLFRYETRLLRIKKAWRTRPKEIERMSTFDFSVKYQVTQKDAEAFYKNTVWAENK